MGNEELDVPAEPRGPDLELAAAIAPGWGRRRASIEASNLPVQEWMIAALRPGLGDTVLELAAGAGDTGFDAAAIVGESGRLIATDFSPAMLELARRRGEERGIGNAEYLEMDAERLELEADSVDGALCRYGYMLMADPAAALAETRRVLRPGGRLALAVWDSPQRNAWVSLGAMALVRAGHLQPPDPAAPGMFALASEERLRALLAAAGFGEVSVEQVAVSFPFTDAGDYVDFLADVGGPLVPVIGSLSPDERAALRAALEPELDRFAVDGGYELPGLALAAAAA